MAGRSELNFEFTLRPKWRSPDLPPTDVMVKEVVQFRKKFESLPEEDKKFCYNKFASAMAVEFIYHTNIGELVGSQTREGTEEIIKSIASKVSNKSGPNDAASTMETINAYKALTKLHSIFKEDMKNEGLLTVDLICEVHKVLMEGLHRDAGCLRKTETFTSWNDSLYFYPKPEIAERKLYGLIDCHNIYIEALSSFVKHSEEEVIHVFKCAAIILFTFVDAHPFGDGNGRMCRLLANYVLTLIAPFPARLYHYKDRCNYIDAIVQCRDNPAEGPRDLAAMLVEGVWRGWKSFFRNLDSRQCEVPLIVQAAKLGDIDRIIDRTLKDRNTMVKREVIKECLVKAIEEVSTENLKECEYREILVPIETNLTNLTMKIKLFK